MQEWAVEFKAIFSGRVASNDKHVPWIVKYPSRTAAVSEKTRILIGALAVDSRSQASGLLVGGERLARIGQFVAFAITVR
ncbi:hypothetical protein [Caballeronia terrestris]|uniref:hypothetical protein n=1 Tax=Caballeronia terrestris TaxID=1226301 RepID=UPI000F743DFD|nr:hypothetical protein [Caballeronia terrestris]